ncbi:hypothetical protein [Bacillus pinisoli]|uniref:hypothetical protein n=1 Tax=Bacillus pinisoli TaxID=2901866 RepID=UPI001FF62DA6|nr:hypothetical protein [Bacillus pinisoli]
MSIQATDIIVAENVFSKSGGDIASNYLLVLLSEYSRYYPIYKQAKQQLKSWCYGFINL